jgi:hypothetical protein
MRTVQLLASKTLLPGIVNEERKGNFTSVPATALIVPGGYVARIIYLTFYVITSAVVANRHPVVKVLNADNQLVAAFPAGVDQAASSTVVYSYCASTMLGNNGGGGYRSVGFGDVLLYNGYTVTVDVVNFQAGDQLNNLIVVYELTDVSPYGLNTGRVDDQQYMSGG